MDDNAKFPKCSVCFNPFDEDEHAPMIIICGHSLCKICINALLEKKETCPICRKLFDKSQINKNIELIHLLSVLNKLKKPIVAENAQFAGVPKSLSVALSLLDVTLNESATDLSICSFCKDSEKLLCLVYRDCADRKPICKPCFEFKHRKNAVPHQTAVWSVAEIPARCQDHPQESVLFCSPCQKVICAICLNLPTHKDHKYTQVIAELEKFNLEVAAKFHQLEEVIKLLKTSEANVDKIYKDLTGGGWVDWKRKLQRQVSLMPMNHTKELIWQQFI